MRPPKVLLRRVGGSLAVLVCLTVSGWGAPVLAAGASPSGTWTFVTEPAGQPYARSTAALAFDPTHGLGVLFGGQAPGGTTLGDTWVNDGDFPGGWSDFTGTGGSAPPPLSGAAISWDAADQYFVLFGGTTADGTPYDGTWTFLNFAWTDISANQTTSPPPTGHPTMAYDPSDSEIVLSDPGNSSSTYVFGGGHWRPLSVAPEPEPRTGAVFVSATTSGGALLFGGRSAATGAALNDTWNFSSGAWRLETGPAPPPSSVAVGTWDPRLPGLLAFLGNYQATWGYVNGTWGSLAPPGGIAPNVTGGESLYYDSVTSYDILFGGTDSAGHTPYGTWGWNVPAPYTDPTLSSATVSTTTWVAVALVVVVPIVLALLWRRPPRPSAATAPATAPAPA